MTKLMEFAPIAITGMGCKLPGGLDSPTALWTQLLAGADLVTVTPPDRWNVETHFHPDRAAPGQTYSQWGGYVKDPRNFDAGFFGLTPREVVRMDPQQRWLVETAWEAIQDAGYPLSALAGSQAGVYIGISSCDYGDIQKRGRYDADMYTSTGGALSIASNRLSYLFDLKGPSLSVDTACSSALVALHLACQAIWRGEIPLAFVGGANAILQSDIAVAFSKAGMLSPTGRCRAFDASADGFVRAEGAVVLVLKPLATALADGDRVYAAIRATAINQDGRTGGLTLPNENAQVSVLTEAYRCAGIAPDQVGYVEAHGTGTPIGDPIEATAIGRVLGVGRSSEQPLWLGSVKSNIGHLEPASGVAGLIKLALAVHHQTIPPNVYFRNPNPQIPFEEFNLRVPTAAIPWAHPKDGMLFGGVNSFGFGGTNVHAVLSSVPASAARPEVPDDKPSIWTVSTRSAVVLSDAALADAEHLERIDANDFVNHARASRVRRSHHPHRLVVVAASQEDAVNKLRAWKPDMAAATGVFAGHASAAPPTIGIVFSGQGTQWPGMARDLFARVPLFRKTIEEIDSILRSEWDRSLVDEIRLGGESVFRSDVGQPLLFALQMGVFRLLQAQGVRPAVVFGHSIGEVAAAVAAGALSLRDAARVMLHRSQAQETTRGTGLMAAVGLSCAEAEPILAAHQGQIHIAAVNSPTDLTLSGNSSVIQTVVEELAAKGVFARLLPFPYAFHSPAMDPCRDRFLATVAGLRPCAEQVSFISTVTGAEMPGAKLDEAYWWRNVREPVQFMEATRRAAEFGTEVFIEVGPHPGLLRYIHRTIDRAIVVPTLHREVDGVRCLAETAALLHIRGTPIDWTDLGAVRHADLPRHPVNRQPFWAEGEDSCCRRLAGPTHRLLGIREVGPVRQWETCLSAPKYPYLPDHGFRTRVVFPAAGHVELMLAAVADGSFASPVGLDDVTFDRALWADNPVAVRTIFDPASRRIRVTARSLSETNEGWETYSRGVCRSIDASSIPASSNHLPPADLKRESVAELYDRFSRAGHHYGALFRTIRQLWTSKDEVWAEIALDPSLHNEASQYFFHPALLDGVLQAGLRAMPVDDERERIFLPLKVERVEWWRRAGTTVTCHIHHISIQDVRCFSDIDIFSHTGEVVAKLTGCCCATKTQDADLRSRETRLFRETWQLADSAAAGVRPSSNWLVIDPANHAGPLARSLSEAGGHVIHQADPLAGLPDEFGHRDGMTTVVVWIAGISGDEAPSIAGVIGCLEPILTASQFLAKTDGSAVHLWLVTAGATWGHTDTLTSPNLLSASAAGMFRTVATELSNVTCRLLDLDPLNPEAHFAQAFKEFQSLPAEDEIAYRGEERFAARLMHMNADALPWRCLPGKQAAEANYTLQTTEPGSLDGLRWVEASDTRLAAHEIEIEVRAVGLNFRDVLKALDKYPLAPTEPRSFGDECAGTVLRVGSAVSDFRIGDAVVAVSIGIFGNRIRVPESCVARIPENLSLEQAATIPIAFLTAEYCLIDVARLEPCETVLIHAAAGGVGQAAIQVAQRIGAEIIGTASPDKHDFLRAQGVAHVFHSRNLSFAEGVREATSGHGVDVVLNSLAGEFIPRSLELLKPDGRFVEIGKKDIYENSSLDLHPFRRGVSFHSIDLSSLLARKPEWIGRKLRSLMDRFAQGQYVLLPMTIYPANRVCDAFRLMAQGKHQGKLIVTPDLASLPGNILCHERPLVRSGAAYLITGGLSGLGLRTAEWLAEQGAEWLILAGRSGPKTVAVRTALENLTARGVRIEVVSCDVTDPAAVSHLVHSSDHNRPPIRGVVHSAMVLCDEPLGRVERASLEKVLAPKIAGAWNLHLATYDLPLDWFVMYSSVATLIGSAGQASYVAANRFLDALAVRRTAEGLPALTLNMGPLAEIGIVAESSGLSRYLDSVGLGLVPPGDVFQFMKFLLRRDVSNAGVARLNWAKIQEANSAARNSHRLGAVLEQDANYARAGGSDALTNLLSRPIDDREAFLLAHLRHGLAAIIRSDENAIDPAAPLTTFGVDSLMAFEFKLRIDRDFRTNTPINRLSAGTTLVDLAAILLGQLTTEFASNSDSTEPSTDPLTHASAPLPPLPIQPAAETSTEFLRVVSRSSSSQEWENLTCDSAAFLYIPDRMSTTGGMSNDQLDELFGSEPFISHLYEMPFGRIAAITLPIRGKELLDSERLEGLVRKAGNLAALRGAKCVSLTGLIPAATKYGRSVQHWLGDAGPQVTTGHATTTAAVVLNLKSMLEQAGRSIDQERLALLGLGSIGQSCLALLLDVLPHPRELTLCDVLAKQGEVERIAARLREHHGFLGPIHVIPSERGLTPELYRATTILTAVSVPDVIQVDRLQPGTIIVDDSYPPGFPLDQAIERAESKADVFFSNAGMLRLSHPIRETVFLPPGSEKLIAQYGSQAFLRELTRDPHELISCILSSLLTDRQEGFRATVGIADLADLRSHYRGLARLGIMAARPQCGIYFTPESLVERFRENHAAHCVKLPNHC